MKMQFEYGCCILLMALSSCSACFSQPIEVDFRQALDMVPDRIPWPSGITFYDLTEAADGFIDKHSDPEAVEFLTARIDNSDAGKLALFALVKLAPSSEVAQTALYDLIYQDIRMRRIAIVAVSYLDGPAARQIAESLVRRPGSIKIRWPAVQLLGAIGETQTLDMLRALLPAEKQPTLRRSIESAIAQIEHRLTEIPRESRNQWDTQEIVYWRLFRDVRDPMPRNIYGGVFDAAETFRMKGFHLSRDFLEYKLENKELFAVALAGYQAEMWAVPQLEAYVKEGGTLGRVARLALRQIRTQTPSPADGQ